MTLMIEALENFVAVEVAIEARFLAPADDLDLAGHLGYLLLVDPLPPLEPFEVFRASRSVMIVAQLSCHHLVEKLVLPSIGDFCRLLILLFMLFALFHDALQLHVWVRLCDKKRGATSIG